MPYRYQPADAAIVLVEMQPEIVRSSKTVSQDQLARAMVALTGAAKTLGVPVFASGVQIDPELEPQLVPELSSHTLLKRKSPGVLDDPDIAALIATAGPKVIAVGGLSSEMAILHTVHSALERRYDVHLLVDACGGISERTEQAAFQQAQAAGAKLSGVASFLVGFMKDQSEGTDKKVFAHISKLWGWSADPS